MEKKSERHKDPLYETKEEFHSYDIKIMLNVMNGKLGKEICT